MTQVVRDSNGRFSPGNQGGPGRRPREIEQEYLRTMASVVDAVAWQAIVERAADDAVAGDPKARAWLSGYLLGQPIARIEAGEPENSFAKLLRQLDEIQPTLASRTVPEASE